MVFDRFTAEFRHLNRIHFGRGCLSVTEELSGVFTIFIGAAEILAEPSGFQLHLCTAFVAFERGAVVAPDFEFSVFDFKPGAIRIVSTHMKLAFFID